MTFEHGSATDLSHNSAQPWTLDGIEITLASHDRQASKRETLAMADAISNGQLPDLGNDWQVEVVENPVSDNPSYRDSGDLPAVLFTGYFSRRRLPVADHLYDWHIHDADHARIAKRVFASPTLANLTPVAATNALSSPTQRQSCITFARAIDGVGDEMRDFVDGTFYTSSIGTIVKHLRSLIALADVSPEEQDCVLQALWEELGLQQYQDIIAQTQMH